MQLFRPEALDHQRHRLLGDVMIMQPVRFMMITALLTTLAIAAGIFSYFGNYAQKETVRGMLVPSAGLITVRPSTAGIVDEVHVEQGMSVTRGDPLVTIRRDVPDIEGVGSLERLEAELAVQEKELKRRLDLEKKRSQKRSVHLKSEIKSAQAEKTHLKSIIILNERVAAIAEEEVTKLGPAVESGIMPEREMRVREQQRLNSESSVLADQQRLITLQGQIDSHWATLELLPLELESTLSDLRMQLTELASRQAESRRGEISTLNAPVSGVITDVRALVGTPTDSSEALFSIRGANDPLIAELFIPTRSAGSIKPGKKVRIAYDAFPYQRYGIYDGVIERMSASVYMREQPMGGVPGGPQTAAYKAWVRLDEQVVKATDKTSTLQPGMEFRADIVLENRRLTDIFFGSIMDAFKR